MEACVDAGQQGVLQWLLKRIRVSASRTKHLCCILLAYTLLVMTFD